MNSDDFKHILILNFVKTPCFFIKNSIFVALLILKIIYTK